MSVAELLSAIRALPKAERVQLLHLLNDGLTEEKTADDGIPEELRKLLPPSGSVIPYHEPITTDAAGWRVIEQMLAELFPTGAAFDVHTPPGGFEAAAALQQLLAGREEQR